VSAPATTTAHESHPAADSANALATPEFDPRERTMFGQDDARAVTVIGKMLVTFFFYSFLVMSAVAIWTMTRGGQIDPHAQASQHAENADE
jgi:hypothetical protein